MQAIDLEAKPYLEIISGRLLRKVSPKRRHGELQGRLWSIISTAAGKRGATAIEWRCHLPHSPTGRTTLVPDVAFASYDRLRAVGAEQAEEPPFAPDVVVEVRSPSDRMRDLHEKVALYLHNGCVLVLDVDPAASCIVAHSWDGARLYECTATFSHEQIPWLTFDVAPLFEGLEIPGL